MSDDESKTYSIPVSTRFDVRVKRRMQMAGFHSVADYVRAAIRADLKQSELEELEWSVLESARRGDYRTLDQDYFRSLRQRAQLTG